MPPKSLTRRGGARSVAVSTTHPANVAAATAKKAAGGGKMHPANVAAAAAKKTAGGGNAIAVSTRESPPRALKIAAIAQIQAEAYAHRNAPIASVAPDSANTTPGVAVLMPILRLGWLFS
jgi:hypothetical protein